MIQYDKNTMLRMVDRDEVLRHLAKDKAKELSAECWDPKEDKGYLENWLQALEWVFNERIKNDPIGTYHRTWKLLMPRSRDYVPPPEPINGITKHILVDLTKLVNGYGWKAVIKAVSEYAKIKQTEMFNAGFDEHSKNWERISEELRKLSRKDVMT